MCVSDSFVAGILRFYSRQLENYVMEKARLSFLDYLACAIGGSKGLQHSAVQQLLSDEVGEGKCHVFGRNGLYPLATAALINGFCAHYLELDDGHRMGAVHIGAPVISALLAVAEVEAISGEDFLRGIITGYEATARLACAVQPGCRQRGYHATGVCGTIGAAVGIAVALRFTEKQLKTAIAAAVAGAAGVLEMQEDASELKPYNAGRAAMDAVIAAYVGKAGFKGPDDPIGGKRGFLKVMTDNPNLEYLVNFKNSGYEIERTYMKLYAACRHAHPAIEAALILRDKVKIEKITSINVRTYKQATEGHSHKTIPSVSSAKMSIPFGVATAFVLGEAGINAFTERSINDEIILNLMHKISVEADEELTLLNPQKRVAIVEVASDEDRITWRIDYPKGEPENPLDRTNVEDKFRSLTSYAGIKKSNCDLIINEMYNDNFSLERIFFLLS